MNTTYLFVLCKGSDLPTGKAAELLTKVVLFSTVLFKSIVIQFIYYGMPWLNLRNNPSDR